MNMLSIDEAEGAEEFWEPDAHGKVPAFLLDDLVSGTVDGGS